MVVYYLGGFLYWPLLFVKEIRPPAICVCTGFPMLINGSGFRLLERVVDPIVINLMFFAILRPMAWVAGLRGKDVHSEEGGPRARQKTSYR